MEAESSPEIKASGGISARFASRGLGLPHLALSLPGFRSSAPTPRGLTRAVRRGGDRPADRALASDDESARTRQIDLTSPLVVAIAAVVLAVVFVAGLTYYGGREFSGRAADTRAADEAASFAAHSSQLATGDAFDGYIQILRYADDPVVNAKASTANERRDAMQRLLYLNVNQFTSLTLAERAGIILATTDPAIPGVKDSSAFSDTRARLQPANSGIVLPGAGRRGYVEYSAPLHDPDGTVWAILIGRADPARVWKTTLAATVDGSRNVIIDSQGRFSAGVPDALLGQPWHGQPLSDGSARANIAGVDSICGLAPIGKDTQIDRGLNVASCLPTSIIQKEQGQATDKQGLITIAGAVLSIVVAAMGLSIALRKRNAPVTAANVPSKPDGPVEALVAPIALRGTGDGLADIPSTPPKRPRASGRRRPSRA